MEKGNNKKTLGILLAIFIILTLFLGGYIIYDKVLSNYQLESNNKQENNSKENDNNNQDNNFKENENTTKYDKEFFDNYLAIFLPSNSASNFKRTIENFSNEDISKYIFWHYVSLCHKGTLKTDQEKSNEEYTGQMTYTVSKQEIDEVVYKMFGKKDYEIIESPGRTGVRKIDDNTYQVFWFASGWYGDKGEIRNTTIENDSAVIEYVLMENIGDTGKETGKMEFYLTKNGDNWNLTKIKLTENE